MNALYPSLEQVETASITANAVRNSKILFQDVQYDELSVYLALTIGREGMKKWGIEHCHPTRRIDSSSLSLCSKSKRDMATENIIQRVIRRS